MNKYNKGEKEMGWWPPNFEVSKKISEAGIDGLQFVIDGKPECPTETVKKHLEKHGAKLCDNVTKKTDYLVLTSPKESNTKKSITAKAYGIPAMDEFSFYYFIGLLFPDQEVVVVPTWLKVIADYSFSGCRNVKEIALPQTIEEIGAGAFTDCTNLVRINIPSNLKLIRWSAFNNCASLQEFAFPDNYNNWIGGGIFMGCRSLQRITLPDCIDHIPGYFFQGCESLREIVIPHNVKEIHREAFRTCTKLRSVTIPDGLRWIQTLAFSGCRSLRNIYLPDTVGEIQAGAFRGCPKLTIRTPKGSSAEDYAKKNGIPVENI